MLLNTTEERHHTSSMTMTLKPHSRGGCINIFANPLIFDQSLVILESWAEWDDTKLLSKTLHVDTMSSFQSSRQSSPRHNHSCFSQSYAWMCAGIARHDCVRHCDEACVLDFSSWKCERPDGDFCFSDRCNFEDLQSETSSWDPFGEGKRINSCYSYQVRQPCELEIASHLALVVILLTGTEVLLLTISAFTFHDAPLLTLEDAICSFLREPDPATREMLFFQLGDAVKQWTWTPVHRLWLPIRQRKVYATSSMRRLAFVILYVVIHSSKLSFTNWPRLATVIAPTTAGVVLSIGSVKQHGFGLSEAFKLGFGAVNVRTIITDWKIPSSGRRAMWSTAILANMGQPLLSLVHYAYNSPFTAIYLSIEWDSYGRRNRKCTRLKGLRVSEVPRGSQRTAHSCNSPFATVFPLLWRPDCCTGWHLRAFLP